MPRLREFFSTHPSGREMLGVIFILVSAIAFSAKAIFIKLAYFYPVDAVTLLALRMLFATPFFLWLAFRSGKGRELSLFGFRDLAAIGILGLLGMYVSSLFDFIGLQYISAGMERTVLFLYPTFVVLITALMNRKSVEKKEILSLGLSYSGIVLITLHEIRFTGGSETFIGTGFIFLCSLTYAAYLIGSGREILRIGAARFTGWSMTAACAACLTHFALTHDLSALIQPLPVYWLGLALGVVSTILPVTLLNAGIKRIGSGKAALISSIGPVSTIVLAHIFLNEAITLRQLAGTGLVLCGVLTISLPKRA